MDCKIKINKVDIIHSLVGLAEARENAKKLVTAATEGLLNKTINFFEIAEGLESTLTHQNAPERSLGTQFLADILHSVPQDFANQMELAFLASFFVNRMKDHHSVIPHVISGYMALVKQENLSVEDGSSIIHSIFQDMHCQSQVMSDRRNIYNIIKYLLLNRKEVVLKINDAFIIGFVSAMDGEKDPRNLMICFSVIPYLTTCLSLKSFAEELFEVVAAYFPIDFIPPTNDPFGIASEDLILGLRNCLSSTDAFAPYCLPLLMEKLDSDITSAKLDSLLTLQACFKNYSAETVSPHSILLWNSLRREVIEGWNEELEKEALSCITCLVSNLEKGPTSPALRDCINNLGSVAMNECFVNMSNPEQKLMHPSANLLLALIETSTTLTITVQKQVLPLLENLIKSKKESSPLKTTITILAKFLNQATRSGLLSQEPLSLFQEPCFNGLFQELFSEDKVIQMATIWAFRTAAISLTRAQKHLVTEAMIKILLTTQNKNFRDVVLSGLQGFDQLDVSVLSLVLNEIKQVYSEKERDRLIFLLETISSLTSTSYGLDTVWSIIWQQMMVLCESGSINCIYYLQCMKKIVASNRISQQDLNFILNDFKSLKKLTSLSLNCIALPSFSDPIPVLQEISNVCQELVHRENKVEVESLICCLLGGDGPLVEDFDKLNIRSLVDEKEEKSCLLIFSMEGLMLCLTAFGVAAYLKEAILKVQHWSLHAKDSRVRESSAILLSVLLNKLPTDSILDSHLEHLKSVIFNKEVSRCTSSVRLLGWISKGLILRGYKDDSTWINELESSLLDTELCTEASECYEFILKDVPAFSAANGVKVRMLYKQRFFESRISSLVQQFQNNQGKAKFCTLLAISYLLPYMPQLILKGHMQKLLPVLAQGLTCGDPIVTKGAVTTLASLLTHSNEDIKPYFSTLYPPLLQLSQSSVITVRMKSLECLESLAQLPTPSIVPYKDEIINGLKPALNDRKRVVRQAASNASCAWVIV